MMEVNEGSTTPAFFDVLTVGGLRLPSEDVAKTDDSQDDGSKNSASPTRGKPSMNASNKQDNLSVKRRKAKPS